MRRLSRVGIPVLVVATAGLGLWLASPRLGAMAFIVSVAKQGGVAASLARLPARAVEEGPIAALPTRHGPMDSRIFSPAGGARRTAILVPGVHLDGIREARLVGLARELAAAGLRVLTVAPADLARYRIATASTDQLEDAIAWAAARPELAPDGRVGMMAISFAGGLGVVAAGRPAVRDHVAFVLSFGGHGDLERVLRYLCLDERPQLGPALRALAIGGDRIHVPKPHDYGAVVTLLNLADALVPPAQVAPLQLAITTFLEASSIDRLDHQAAATHFARARELGQALPEPARTLMSYVNERDVDRLGKALAPALATLALPAALSSDRSPPPSAPVFLLHGADDSVVPASEMLFVAQRLRSTTPVHAFASQLITHAEANRRAALAETWRLAGFWRDLLAL